MKTTITKEHFRPIDIRFQVDSIEELKELYSIIGDLKHSTGSGYVYDKIGNILEIHGYEIGINVNTDDDQINSASEEWFNKTEYCDQKDGFIAGAKWRESILKLRV